MNPHDFCFIIWFINFKIFIIDPEINLCHCSNIITGPSIFSPRQSFRELFSVYAFTACWRHSSWSQMVTEKGQVETIFCTPAFLWENWGNKIYSHKSDLLQTCLVCAIEMSANQTSINSTTGPQPHLHLFYIYIIAPVLSVGFSSHNLPGLALFIFKVGICSLIKPWAPWR